MDEGIAAGARARQLARLLGVGLTTLQRWRRQFAGDGGGVDRRKGSSRQVAHRLSEEERQRILLTCNEPECPVSIRLMCGVNLVDRYKRLF